MIIAGQKAILVTETISVIENVISDTYRPCVIALLKAQACDVYKLSYECRDDTSFVASRDIYEIVLLAIKVILLYPEYHNLFVLYLCLITIY